MKTNQTVVHSVKRLWRHLDKHRRYQCGLLLLLMLISAVAEVISLGAVLPFLGVLAAPELVYRHSLVAEFAPDLGITSAEQLLLPFTIIFVMAALVSGAVRLLQVWANTRFAYAVGHDLSVEVYRRTLYQPYQVHLARNSSEVISGVDKVNSAIVVLTNTLLICGASLIVLCVILALLAIDPFAASIAFLGFGAIYGGVTWWSRQHLLRNSQRIAGAQIKRLKALQEGLGGIRDVLLGGKQSAYSNLYRRADWEMRKAERNNLTIDYSPRYIVEALGMTLIAFLAFGLGRQTGEMAAALPTLGALAMGAQRLLPNLQQIYAGWAIITGRQASLQDVLKLLDQPLPQEMLLPAPSPLAFRKEIRFDSVRFKYSSAGPLIIAGLDLVIPRGARVGFVGSTGSGKSTTIDLFMGLLQPTAGQILIDSQPLADEKIRAWQRIIAHVPQSIFLADTTLAENIAFGVPLKDIDFERVKKAADSAHIAEFIEKNPQGYHALVGERGIRLSGGQRQRIGIARALYDQAEIMVFDEATSALDNTTEQAVMDAIEKLGRDLTILIIAHRLSTVKRCDLIVELDQGKVVAQGTYEQLLECSPTFHKMAYIRDSNS
ncbi:MAG: ABC transporter ATP-binding protein [Deltaproteobacteria bacterium RIFOXYD12_FULL_55_16]|nr:MAG: ABC transporter ATP-binding protein [Deltaproteobacteria bacterium RIFOXYD12_FULL_55_16]